MFVSAVSCFVGLMLSDATDGLPFGAPSDCCADLMPDHYGMPARSTPPPYQVLVTHLGGTEYQGTNCFRPRPT